MALSMGICAPCLAAADVYFVAAPQTDQGLWVARDPQGSATNPFASVAQALASGAVKGGDEVRLLAGEYGDLVITDARFEQPVTIAAATGQITPDMAGVHLTLLSVANSQNLILADFQIWPETPAKGHLVATDRKSANITFTRLDVRSRQEAAQYPSWDMTDWTTWRRPGIMLRGPDNSVNQSQFTGLSFAIATIGARARVENNIVQGFSGDGIRGLGDQSVFRANLIKDCVQIDKNHADGFQSWSVGTEGRSGTGTVRGLTIEANVFEEWTQPNDNPLRCSLQGIGLFDGMYEDVIIQNNALSVSAPHGISIAGGINVKIVHNTLVNPRVTGKKQPWIAVSPHKKGMLSERVIIANNIAPWIRFGTGKPGMGIVQSHNLVVRYPAESLIAPFQGDLRPKANSKPIDAADPAYAAQTDITGQPRGDRPDIGAWELP
jgi:hypothetical protein